MMSVMQMCCGRWEKGEGGGGGEGRKGLKEGLREKQPLPDFCKWVVGFFFILVVETWSSLVLLWVLFVAAAVASAVSGGIGT
jgi:hypothetical protein